MLSLLCHTTHQYWIILQNCRYIFNNNPYLLYTQWQHNYAIVKVNDDYNSGEYNEYNIIVFIDAPS